MAKRNEIKSLKEANSDNLISRRDAIKTIAWTTPIVLSFMIPTKAIADEGSIVCTSAGDPSICDRCEVKACDTEGCLTCDYEPSCPNNCDWCDGGLLDFCNPNF